MKSDSGMRTQLFDIVRVFEGAGYRDLARDSGQQRMSVAQRLLQMGATADDLELLWQYAQKCGRQPANLFAYWLAKPERTMAQLHEMLSKAAWVRKAKEQEVKKDIVDIGATIHNLAQHKRIG